MVRILAIETATDACSAALVIGTEVQERFAVAPRQHGVLLLPYAESLLSDAGLSLKQLDAIAFGRGPGSFTGLRIAAGMAQGMAFGAELPVVPVSTLAALAQGTVHQQAVQGVLVALDARMKEVYWGAYRCQKQGLVELLGEEQVCAPGRVAKPEGDGWVGAGSGWQSYADVLKERCSLTEQDIYPDQYPRAADVARLAVRGFEQGHAVAPEQAVPVYLRDTVARPPQTRG